MMTIDELTPGLPRVARRILRGVGFDVNDESSYAQCTFSNQKQYLDLFLGRSIGELLPPGRRHTIHADLALKPEYALRGSNWDPTHLLCIGQPNLTRTFAMFVPDDTNREATMAALRACGMDFTDPAFKRRTPTAGGTVNGNRQSLQRVFYIYGPPGVGKSHLLTAIATSWLEDGHDAVFVDGRSLKDALLGRYSRGGTPSALDYLSSATAYGTIIDGIDVLEEWPLLQETLAKRTSGFHFPGDTLVLSGRKSPDQLRLHPALKALVDEGETIEITPPGERLRRGVLTMKLERLPDLAFPDHVIDTIAAAPIERIDTLVHAFHRLVLAYDAGDDLSSNRVDNVLRACGVSTVSVSYAQVQHAMLELGTERSIKSLKGARPGKEITAIRNSLMRELVEKKGLSRSAVGRAFDVSPQYVARIVSEAAHEKHSKS
jgi:hypothetical protein